MANASHVLALDPYVSVDHAVKNGVRAPSITFSGANIYIVSGSGTTNDNGNPTGLGNLIIGYDEAPSFSPFDRSGSHNLVIGRYNQFTQTAFGGLVAGEMNTISNEGASVTGGEGNTASGRLASVMGGLFNTASGVEASVSGGSFNIAGGDRSVVLGGSKTTGSNVTDNKDDSIAPQAPLNFP